MKTRSPHPGIVLALFFIICYPVGVYKIWKCKASPMWYKLLYTIVGLPIFCIIYGIIGVIIFASFLPDLDRSIGERSDRTIMNSIDDYSVTFLKTSRETKGEYEEVEVLLQPGGGNDWHYHTAILGYSDSFLQGLPGFIQEPLIPALSKIAQWKGYAKDLDPFCK